jgi:methylmalonyl-CoA mutase N-terminal domain/subunit
MQGQIEDSAYQEARRQSDGDSVVVGVNRFTADESESLPVLELDPELEANQKLVLAGWRERRVQEDVEANLDVVVSTARTNENLMPAIKDALSSGATVGEVSDSLREVFGQYRPAG